jgi:PhnB protein
MHAQVNIGDSMLMIGGASADCPAMPAGIYLYVDNADAVHARAVAAGATSLMTPTDEFWGDRMGGVRDPSGTSWWIATHVEDVPPDELAKRAEMAMPTAV